MKKNILFSIIVPIYNCEMYIEDCIKSILIQTFKNFELILVNDGSTDTSGEICKKYLAKDKRIKYICQQNSGQGVARNKALEIAIGDYIIFIDADDWVYANYLEICNKIILENEIDMICFQGKNFVNDRNIDFRKKNNNVFNLEIVNTYKAMYYYAIKKNIDTTVWTKVCKRELFKSIRFPRIRCREDAYIVHELLGRCKNLAICNTDYYFYYIRNNSTERKEMSDDRFISIDIGKRCLDFYKKNYIDLYYFCYCNIYMDRKKNMLAEIIQKNSVRKYFKKYNEIYKSLRKDLRILKKDCKFDNYKKYINLKKIHLWAYHPYLCVCALKIKNIKK